MTTSNSPAFPLTGAITVNVRCVWPWPSSLVATTSKSFFPAFKSFVALHDQNPFSSAVTFPLTPSGRIEIVTFAPGSVRPANDGLGPVFPFESIDDETVSVSCLPPIGLSGVVFVESGSSLNPESPVSQRQDPLSVQYVFLQAFVVALTDIHTSPPGQSVSDPHVLLQESRMYENGVGVMVRLGVGEVYWMMYVVGATVTLLVGVAVA
jgi:hypothetical protein